MNKYNYNKYLQVGGVRVSNKLSNQDVSVIFKSIADNIDDVYDNLNKFKNLKNLQQNKNQNDPFYKLFKLFSSNMFIFKKNRNNLSSLLTKTLKQNLIRHTLFSKYEKKRNNTTHLQLSDTNNLISEPFKYDSCLKIIDDFFAEKPNVLLLNREYPDFDKIQKMYSQPSNKHHGLIQFEYNLAIVTKYFLIIFTPIQVKVGDKICVLMSIQLVKRTNDNSTLWKIHNASLKKINAENTILSLILNNKSNHSKKRKKTYKSNSIKSKKNVNP